MSALSASLVCIIIGFIVLASRLFFFVDMKDVEKQELEKMKMNSFLLIALSAMFLTAGIILLFAYRKSFVDPLGILIDDFYKGKTFLGIIIMFLGVVFLFYREKMFVSWKEKGYKVPDDVSKYKDHIILIGIALVIIGLLILIL